MNQFNHKNQLNSNVLLLIFYSRITCPFNKVNNSGDNITISFYNNKLLLTVYCYYGLAEDPLQGWFIIVLCGCICGFICRCQDSGVIFGVVQCTHSIYYKITDYA